MTRLDQLIDEFNAAKAHPVPVTAEREVAERIAHRMSQIGWVENNDFVKALSEDGHPGLELLVDGLRYLVSVELRGREYQSRDQEVLF